jgi:predicted ester cyclase
MTGQTEQDASAYVGVARRWFTDGWKGNLALADDLFSENLRTNGVAVGVDGPKGRIRERLNGFPDIETSIEDIFASGDRLVIVLVWRGTHTGPYGGVEATGKPVEIRDMAVWTFADGKVVAISTLQDQFGLLKQIGFLPSAVRAA